eukprot:TRINITY_DN3999_c0_g1_i1.p1 TRINITY_DN3999_c0_g1~~TRINITY_DN3999_c0_g1_i1.p1  ORF type:complete len:288 (+),score=45.19 TRINITY_DN3999_c0_g1_i1:45-866(+)
MAAAHTTSSHTCDSSEEDCLRLRLKLLTSLPSSPRDPLELRHLPAFRLTQLAQEAKLSPPSPSFQRLVSELTTHLSSLSSAPSSDVDTFKNEKRRKTQQILKNFASVVSHEEWQRYVHFNDTHYTRNLVTASDDFELIVICWKDGQRSRIHNHAGSGCFVTCLQGPLTETFYQNFLGSAFETNDPDHLLGPVGVENSSIQLTGKRDLRAGDVGFIDDQVGLHAMSAEQGNCVTLHLYSPPIRVSTVIEPENALVLQRLPGFWSVAGLVIAFDK